MLRYLMFLATLCAVQVLALSRVKRATAGDSGNAEMVANSTGATAGTGSKVGPAGGASEAPVTLRAKPARRAYQRRGFEYKVDPIDLNRPKKGPDRETSSSSGAKDDKKDDNAGADKESMGMTDSEESSNSNGKKNKKYVPLSTEERHGWRKWHRKCVKCPSEMRMKWRDPRIKWICGAYQRARRSFKSLCMMHYRNCQDGTMFVMIHEHRCANSTPDDSAPHGDHFMYDYKVRLSDDSSKSGSSESDSSEESSSESSA